MVKNFNPRKLMPTLNLRRVDKVAAYATVASSLALQDAKLWPIAGDGGRVGLVVELPAVHRAATQLICPAFMAVNGTAPVQSRSRI